MTSIPRHTPGPTSIPTASSSNPAWPPIPTCQNPLVHLERVGGRVAYWPGTSWHGAGWSYMHTKDSYSYAVLIPHRVSALPNCWNQRTHTPSEIRSNAQTKPACARKELGTTRKVVSRDESHTQLSRKLGGCTVLLQYPSLQLGLGRLV